MKRISTATRSLNLFGAGKDGFKDGDLVNGVAATDFDASWFNNVQEELATIVEAAGIALSGAATNQLLLALRAAGVFTTPAKGDATTKAATTAFVKAAGLQASGAVLVTATGALTAAAHGGATVAINAAGATTQTLPAANALTAGDRIELMNINTGLATVSRAGADTIQLNNATGTSVALGAGDTLTLASDGVSKWYAVGGSAQLKSSSAFGASVGASGWGRLPWGPNGGFLLQNLVVNVNASSVGVFTLPTSFPNNFFGVLSSVYGTTLAAGNNAAVGALPNGLSQVSVQNLYSASLLSVQLLCLGN